MFSDLRLSSAALIIQSAYTQAASANITLALRKYQHISELKAISGCIKAKNIQFESMYNTRTNLLCPAIQE